MSLHTFALFLSLLASEDRPGAPADQAKAAAEAFMKGFQYLNLDDIMKIVDTPWYHDGKTVVYDRKELQTDFGRLLDRYRGSPKVKYEFKAQLAYGAVRG